MKTLRKWMPTLLIAGLVLAALAYAFLPQPVPVDTDSVRRGTLLVTVDDDGETRVRDVYVVSAPLSGRVLRFQGDVGDDVVAATTELASILPSDPAFLDVRTRSELEAALGAAEAARALAAAEVERIEAELDYARTEYERAVRLAEAGTISAAELDRARTEAKTRQAALMTARAQLDVREHELDTARASLLDPSERETSSDGGPGCCYTVRAPVSGKILRIFRESEGVVEAGAPLVEIGQPTDLEIVADLLSTDAVRVSPGDDVLIERWGGDGVLHGRVRRVEPYGFTKVSSLGIEEQRVNVIVDITDPIERWSRLGHGYRIEVRIVLWRGDDVLQVPAGALFRVDDHWAVFAVEGNKARVRRVQIGHANGEAFEILEGLREGERIVLHPSDRVADGVRVVARGRS